MLPGAGGEIHEEAVALVGGSGLLARARVPPCAPVSTGLKAQGHVAAAREIDGIDLAWLGEAVIAVRRQFVMRVGLPPVKAGEEIDHMSVPFEHCHGVIPTTVEPSTARVRPHVRSAPRGLTGGLVSTGHDDLPGRPAERVSRLRSGSFDPQWVVVLVPVLLIGLRDDPARAFLLLSLGERMNACWSLDHS